VKLNHGSLWCKEADIDSTSCGDHFVIIKNEEDVEEIYASKEDIHNGKLKDERRNTSLNTEQEQSLYKFIRTYPGPPLKPSARGWDMADRRPASIGRKVHITSGAAM
jgi:hypothetical protein